MNLNVLDSSNLKNTDLNNTDLNNTDFNNANLKNNVEFSYKKKKKLEKDIANLLYDEQLEILNIIINNKQKYSKNNKGIFFNLKYIDINTLIQLENYVSKCKDKAKLNNENSVNNNTIHSSINSISNDSLFDNDMSFTLDKDEIKKELIKIESKNKEHFIFQNFLDKLSVTNIKSFQKSDQINYPQLNNSKKKLAGVNERLFKKCRDGIKEEDYNFNNESECVDVLNLNEKSSTGEPSIEETSLEDNITQ